MKKYKALLTLEKTCPELFQLVALTDFRVDDSVQIASARIKDGRFLVTINSQVYEALDSFNLAALYEHELLHIVLCHLSKKDFKDRQLANVAMDAVINSLGKLISQRSKLDGILQGGIFLDDLNKKHGLNLSIYFHDTQDIYNALEGLSDKPQQWDSGLESSDTSESMSPEQVQQVLDSHGAGDIVEKIADKNAGNSKDCKALSMQFQQKKRDKAFRALVTQFFASNRCANKKSSWKRLSRRYDGAKGRIKAKNQKILLAIDTSGSMLDEATIKKMQWAIASAQAHDFTVDLIFGDTQKRGEIKNANKNFKIDHNTIKGGGGTVLKFIFDAHESGGYDGTLVLTDGEFNHAEISQKKKDKILFLLTDSRPIKNYKQVRI